MPREIPVKTKAELDLMIEGGRKLARVKKALKKEVVIGKSALDIERVANELIKDEGGEASFKKVPGYRWATCVNVNQGVVHGIPKQEIIFRSGDVVSVDVGMFYKGFHTDTSFSVGLDVAKETAYFLEIGVKALNAAIKAARPGSRVWDISQNIEKTLMEAGFTPIKDLVGHGVGRNLHEAPPVPCFTEGAREKSPVLPEGAVIAIEVMYLAGKNDLVLDRDGWTIATADGKIAALFEETVAITSHGPLVLTED